MAKNIEIKCNFDSVFAQFNTMEDLKAVANNIVKQVEQSYKARAQQLAPAKSSVAKTQPVVVKKAESTPAEPTTRQSAKSKPKTEAVKPKSKEGDDVLISITDTKAIGKLNLKFEKYSERSWALYGDTKPIRHGLKELGGAYNRFLKNGEGWVFNNKNAEACAKALGLSFANA